MDSVLGRKPPPKMTEHVAQNAFLGECSKDLLVGRIHIWGMYLQIESNRLTDAIGSALISLQAHLI